MEPVRTASDRRRLEAAVRARRTRSTLLRHRERGSPRLDLLLNAAAFSFVTSGGQRLMQNLGLFEQLQFRRQHAGAVEKRKRHPVGDRRGKVIGQVERLACAGQTIELAALEGFLNPTFSDELPCD